MKRLEDEIKDRFEFEQQPMAAGEMESLWSAINEEAPEKISNGGIKRSLLLFLFLGFIAVGGLLCYYNYETSVTAVATDLNSNGLAGKEVGVEIAESILNKKESFTQAVNQNSDKRINETNPALSREESPESAVSFDNSKRQNLNEQTPFSANAKSALAQELLPLAREKGGSKKGDKIEKNEQDRIKFPIEITEESTAVRSGDRVINRNDESIKQPELDSNFSGNRGVNGLPKESEAQPKNSELSSGSPENLMDSNIVDANGTLANKEGLQNDSAEDEFDSAAVSGEEIVSSLFLTEQSNDFSERVEVTEDKSVALLLKNIDKLDATAVGYESISAADELGVKKLPGFSPASFSKPTTVSNKEWMVTASLFKSASSLSFGANNVEQSLDDKNESASFSDGMGVRISLSGKLKGAFYASGGLEYQQLVTRFDNTSTQIREEHRTDYPLTVWLNKTSGDTLRVEYGDATATITATRKVVHYNKFNQINVPLLVGFQNTRRGFAYGVFVGPVLNYTTKQSGRTLNLENEIVYFNELVNGKAIADFNIGFRLQTSLSYQVAPQWSLTVDPVFNYQRYSQFDGAAVNTNIIQLQLGLGAAYRF